MPRSPQDIEKIKGCHFSFVCVNYVCQYYETYLDSNISWPFCFVPQASLRDGWLTQLVIIILFRV